MTSFHDVPSAADLVEAVRDFLERDVMPALRGEAVGTEGRVNFHTRVAVNVLGMVERELRLGPAQVEAHAAGLARLGFSSEADLSSAIREGRIANEHIADVEAFIRETVRAKLEVANPRHLQTPRSPA